MTVHLDHTIVAASDKQAAAEFLSELLDLPAPKPVGHFVAVELDGGLSLDYADAERVTPQHYAFRVAPGDFEAVVGRIRARGLAHWADPSRSRPGQLADRGTGRGVYVEDPSGHLLEVLTRPDRVAAAA